MGGHDLLDRVIVDPDVCGGAPCIRGSRTEITVLLDSLAEGLSIEEVLDHFPHIKRDDVLAAIAYASGLARENLWKLAG